jgi:molybdopterin synthase catalytic subunit
VRVEVRLFAMLRAKAGRRSVSVELADGADVAAAWDALVEELPMLAGSARSVRFARNGRYVETAEALADGDELAVIPPVAGGGEERVRRLELTEHPMDDALIGALRLEVSTPADGAVVVFLGQTRETPGTPAPGQEDQAARFADERVEGLTYEALESMVLGVLGEVADEIEASFGVRRLVIIHRVGEVALGEVSVAIAVAAPHRDAAFAACRYAIEELKARAPIWKAERFAGGEVWMGQPARTGPVEPSSD